MTTTTHRGRAYDGGPSVFEMPDTGCRAGGPSCLSCRLPRCVLDETQVERRAAMGKRDAELAAAYRAALGTPRLAFLLAARYGVSVRTVHRAVARMEE